MARSSLLIFLAPEDERDRQVPLGNALWQRALELAWKILEVDGFFILEHPRDSKAWALVESQRLMSRAGVQLCRVDMCAFEGAAR